MSFGACQGNRCFEFDFALNMMNPFPAQSFAIDLGNNNTVLADRNGVLMSAPSFIVFDVSTKKVKAVGDQAYDIVGKSHENLKAVQPLKWGVIADYESAREMIQELVSRTFPGRKWFRGYQEIVSGVPYVATEVERRALRDILDQFNSRKSYLVEEPLAAAIGMGLNIAEAEGKLIVDIGGGITEIVVISLSGIAVFKSIKTAGDAMTEEIRDYLRREYNLLVGWKTAEQIKMNVGAVSTDITNAPAPMIIKGKDLIEGLPVERTIGHHEVCAVLDKPFRMIEESIVHVLETCPPELASDIYGSGIHVTGGGALLRGLTERLHKTIGLPVHIDRDPLLAVSKGTSRVLRDTRGYRSILQNQA